MKLEKVSNDKNERLTFVIGVSTGLLYDVKPLGWHETLSRKIRLYERSIKTAMKEKEAVDAIVGYSDLDDYLDENGAIKLRVDTFSELDSKIDKVDRIELANSVKDYGKLSFKEIVGCEGKDEMERLIKRNIKKIGVAQVGKTDSKILLEPLRIFDGIVDSNIEDFEEIKEIQDEIMKEKGYFMPKEIDEFVGYHARNEVLI